jgi:hypothetical protein
LAIFLISRRPTSFERRFSEEFEESLLGVLVRLRFLLRILPLNMSARMARMSHLHASMPHVEKPIFLCCFSNQSSDKPWNNTWRTGKHRSTGAGHPVMLRW